MNVKLVKKKFIILILIFFYPLVTLPECTS